MPDSRDAGSDGPGAREPIDVWVPELDGRTDARPGARADAGRKPVPCGKKIDGSTTHIDFSCAEVLDEFDFFTPTPYQFGPGIWGFARLDGNGILTESGNVKAFPNGHPDGGAWRYPEFGTFAVYEPLDFADGSISVHVTTPDSITTIVLVARYRDPFHCVYLSMGYPQGQPGSWSIGRRQDGIGPLIGKGTLPVSSWDGPGHRIGLEFVGDRFTPYIDGVPLGDFHGDGVVSSGKVGIEALTLENGQFDDMDVVTPLGLPRL